MKRKKTPLLFAALVILTLSCKKDEPQVTASVQQITPGGSGFVYVLNEGNFMSSNASITRLDLTNGQVIQDIYALANNSNPLPGDVLQSMQEKNGLYYIVMNNSGKIIKVNQSNFNDVGYISGFTSPRYILPVSNSKAYVSDLYSNSISIVDLSNNSISGNINLSGWTEEMFYSYGNVYVTNKTRNYVYLINAVTNAVIDSIHVGYGSGSIVEDKFGKLWILSSGDISNNIAGTLSCIDPQTKTADTTFNFSLSKSPFKMKINPQGDKLYWIDSDGIYSFSISAQQLPTTPSIAKGSKEFYGLGVDPSDGTLYVADAIDYNQQGKIYRYSQNLTLIDQFSCGIIPGNFYFQK
jgi:YVTN family beta-propeller protein